jgi:hypothetical protein
MTSDEEILDCMWTVDELLTEIEELLAKKNYSLVEKKVREAKETIAELKDDDDASDDRQEVEMHMDKIL